VNAREAPFKNTNNRSPKISMMDQSTIAATTEIGSSFRNQIYSTKTPNSKPVKVLHMTVPDDRFSKVLFS
jgi:hypothetical protein